MNNIRIQIAKIYIVTFTICLIYYIWIKTTNIFIPCIYYKTTGLLCPGCGMTRMFNSLLSLKFKEAFYYNRAVFVLFFMWNTIAALCFIGKPRFVQSSSFLFKMFGFSTFLLLFFCIIRNIY